MLAHAQVNPDFDHIADATGAPVVERRGALDGIRVGFAEDGLRPGAIAHWDWALEE